MFNYLQIYDPSERRLVGCADVVLRAGAAVARLRPRRPAPAEPRRVLVLRLERIGDFLMTLDALAAVRRRAPTARIDLVVGSWNEALARLVPDIDRCESLDAPWLARGATGARVGELVGRARGWRRRGYDLAVNFEPDIRSNALLALSGAPRRVGFRSGGGGALLTQACDYDPRAHTAANARRLVDVALPEAGASPARGTPDGTRLAVPENARQRARTLLSSARRPLVGVHASGGRPVKQWEPGRFGEAAARLARSDLATIVLTGAEADRPLGSSTCSSPATPVRCTWLPPSARPSSRSSGRRIRRDGVRWRARPAWWPPSCGAGPATAFACRRAAARDARRTAWWVSRWRMSAARPSSCSERRACSAGLQACLLRRVSCSAGLQACPAPRVV